MMRCFFIAVLFVPILGFAQDSIINYTRVVEMPGSKKEDLFIKARQWFNATFKDSRAVLRIADSETGELAGKGIAFIPVKMKMIGGGTSNYEYPTDFTVSIHVKDGKYKYSFSNFYVMFSDYDEANFGILTSSPTTNLKWPMASKAKMLETYTNTKKSVEVTALVLIQSLNEAMAQNIDF